MKESSPLLPNPPSTTTSFSSETPPSHNEHKNFPFSVSKLIIGSSIGVLFVLGIVLFSPSSYFSNKFASEGIPTFSTAASQHVETISVYTNKFTGIFEIIRGRRDPDAEAIGTYQLNVENAGWNYLEVEATPQDDSMEKYLKSMRAMGYVEGFLTWRQIEQYYPNYYQGMFDTLNPYPVDPDIRIQQYLLDNFHWMSEKSKAKYTESAHWLTVRGIVEQLEGLVDGFIDGRQEYRSIHGYKGDDDDLLDDQPTNSFDNPSNLNGNIYDNTHLTNLEHPYILHFMLLNSNGDLYQVVEKLNALDEAVKNALNSENIQNNNTSYTTSIHRKMSNTSPTKLSLMKSTHGGDHCSAFIKMLPDQTDVVFAHNTWDDYRDMGPRIFKHYIFPPWPIELKKEERQKDTFVEYKHSPSDHTTSKGKQKHHHSDNSKDKEEEEEEDHCLCPANQFSKPIPKSSNSDIKSEFTRYHFPPHSYFSSSPGVLTSVDDFYTTYTSPNLHIAENKNKNCYCEGPGGRLAIMETSLEVKKSELYQLIHPESLLSWIRVRSANLIAIDGKDWISKFSYDHSGTYANQWMIIDFTKFQEKNEFNEKSLIQPGFLTIVEEMPGLIKTGDETQTLLSQEYWASYNEPYFRELADYSGNTEDCENTRQAYALEHDKNDIFGLWPGEINCYSTCSRARLFHRLQSSIENIHDVMSLITYNNYQDDKESFNDSCETISCREDLQSDPANMRAFGAIDAKVSSILRSDIYRDIKTPQKPTSHVSFSSFHHIYPREPEFYIHLGPTTSSQEPFCWDQFEEKQNSYYRSIRNNLKEIVNNLIDESDTVAVAAADDPRQASLRGLSSASKEKGQDHSQVDTKQTRERHPSIEYNHYGQPNCFDYDWVTVPPVKDL